MGYEQFAIGFSPVCSLLVLQLFDEVEQFLFRSKPFAFNSQMFELPVHVHLEIEAARHIMQQRDFVGSAEGEAFQSLR
jgi:hypothetical protein